MKDMASVLLSKKFPIEFGAGSGSKKAFVGEVEEEEKEEEEEEEDDDDFLAYNLLLSLEHWFGNVWAVGKVKWLDSLLADQRLVGERYRYERKFFTTHPLVDDK